MARLVTVFMLYLVVVAFLASTIHAFTKFSHSKLDSMPGKVVLKYPHTFLLNSPIRQDPSTTKDSNFKITFRELLVPPVINKYLIVATIVSQIFILSIASIAGVIFNIDPLSSDTLSWELESIVQGIEVGVVLFYAGLVADRTPLDLLQNIRKETQYFTLMLLGRLTDLPKATLYAAILSIAAGFCEEVTFRGFLFNAVESISNSDVALVSSSLLFGLAHSPVWGADAILESILGGVFGLEYVMSGHNLAVPIITHALYDFLTILVTWNGARNDLTGRLNIATAAELKRLLEYDQHAFDAFCSKLFHLLDLNGDGGITAKELDFGLKLSNLDSKYFGDYLEGSRRLFQQFDRDGDGKISVDEFNALLRLETAMFTSHDIQRKPS